VKKVFDPKSKEPFLISRSRLEKFLECQRCFYLEMKYGLRRPSMPGFTLNMAVDALLKKEFDIYRTEGQSHPLMENYGIKAVPYRHPEIDNWRNNFKGVRYHYQPTNFIIYGAVDDVWQDEGGDLIVVDYKATSTEKVISLDDQYRQSYKRQMEVYQWLLRRNGFPVSDQGYFVYANGIKDNKAFDGQLEFRVEIIPYRGDDGWVEEAIKSAHQCLMSEEIPPANLECEYCRYHRELNEIENKENTT